MLGVGATHSSSDDPRNQQEVKEVSLPKVLRVGSVLVSEDEDRAAHVLLTVEGRTSLFFRRLQELCPHFLRVV